MRTAALVLAYLAVFAVAEDGPTPLNRRTLSFSLASEDLNRVVKARFFVSADGGATWTLVEERILPPGPKEVPRFRYTADRDGVFGFATAVRYGDQHGESDPRPGQTPGFSVLIDTVVPTLTVEPVRLDGRDAGAATVRLRWAAADANLIEQPVQVEVSSDAGRSFVAVQRLAASGEAVVVVALAGDARVLPLCLTATDRAGNRMVSAVQTIVLPEPRALPLTVAPAPVADDGLSTALRSLPASGVAGPPDAAAVERVATPAVAAGAVPAAPATVAATPPRTPDTVPVRAAAGRPDIVIPPGSVPPLVPAGPLLPPPSADGALLTSGGIEAEYLRRRAAPVTADPQWAQRERPPGALRPAEPPALAAAAPVPPPRELLSGREAALVLEHARAAAARNDHATARDLYVQLRASTLAGPAAGEELRLLRRTNHLALAAELASTLPPTLVDDAVRVEHAHVLMALNRFADAIPVLVTVQRASAHAEEATCLLGECLIAQRRLPEARKVLNSIAGGRSEHALAARDLLLTLGR